MGLQFRLHRCFSQLFNQRGENAILAAQVLAFTQCLDGRFHVKVDVVFHVSFLLVSGQSKEMTQNSEHPPQLCYAPDLTIDQCPRSEGLAELVEDAV